MVKHEVLQTVRPEDVEQLRQFRCCRCGKLLCYECIKSGRVQIKCRNCKEINEICVEL